MINKRSLLCYTLLNLDTLTNDTIYSLIIFKPDKSPEKTVNLHVCNTGFCTDKNYKHKLSLDETISNMRSSGKNDEWTVVKSISKSKSTLSVDSLSANDRLSLSNNFEILNHLHKDPDNTVRRKDFLNIPPHTSSYLDNSVNYNNNKKTGSLRNHEAVQISVVGDSHARDVAYILGTRNGEFVSAFGVTKPNATFSHLKNDIRKLGASPSEYLVVCAGANNAYNGHLQEVFDNYEEILMSTKSKKVFVVGVPFRRDVSLHNEINWNILNINIFLNDISAANDRFEFIDIGVYPERFLSKDGVHLNYRGKIHLGKLRLATTLQESKLSVDHLPLLTEGKFSIIEDDMSLVIDQNREDKTVAFVHSISADIQHERNMSAGVAVIFRRKFGRPIKSDCTSKFLAVQNSELGASVYGLITMDLYNGKPTDNDYDSAFKALEEDLKSNNTIKKIFCSPVGCIRDLIKIDKFASKIVNLQRSTNVKIHIVTQEQASARRRLRGGLSHPDFLNKLHDAIISFWKRTSTPQPQQHGALQATIVPGPLAAPSQPEMINVNSAGGSQVNEVSGERGVVSEQSKTLQTDVLTHALSENSFL